MNAVSQILSEAFLIATISQAAPIFLAALGGMFTHHANILNVALDGMMLMGAFAGISVGAASQNIWLAMLAAAGVGLAMALIFGWAVLWARADPLVVGIGIGLAAAGLSVLLLSSLYHNEGAYEPSKFPPMPTLRLGPLAHIPVLGPAFEGQTLLVGLAVLLIPVTWWLLFRTPYGVHVRAVGEREEAASAAGLPVRRLRLSTALLAGLLSGLAGAQLAMASLDQFIANMTNGRGYIALAAIFVGRARPMGVALACLAFGATSAVGDQLQLDHLPSNLMLMLPYVVTVLVLLWVPLRRALRRRHAGRRSEDVTQA